MSCKKFESAEPTHYLIGVGGVRYLYLIEDGDVFQKIGGEWAWVDSVERYVVMCLEYPSFQLKKIDGGSL